MPRIEGIQEPKRRTSEQEIHSLGLCLCFTNWHRRFKLTQSGLGSGVSHPTLITFECGIVVCKKNGTLCTWFILTLSPLRALCTYWACFQFIFIWWVRISFHRLRKLVRIYCYSWWYGNLTYTRCDDARANNSSTFSVFCVLQFLVCSVCLAFYLRRISSCANERIFVVVSIDNVPLFSCLHIVLACVR